MPELRFVRSPIPKSVLDRFRSLLALPQDKLRGINQWVSSHLQVLTESEFDYSEIQSAATEIGISPSDLLLAVSFIGTVLIGADVAGPFDVHVLAELGLGEVSNQAAALLEGIVVPAAEVEYARQKGLAVQSVIATLENVDVVCDLRAIFRRLPSTSDAQQITLLGVEPVALVSVELNDSVGNDSVCVFQMSERTLRNLIDQMQGALTQFEVLKEMQKGKFVREVH